jgi:DNA-binding NtrC family response regulator
MLSYEVFFCYVPKQQVMEHSPKKILVIDDDLLFTAILDVRLRNEGFEVLSCQTGEEGFEQYQRWKPDLTLLDIRLPSMSGHEVMERIKTLDPVAKVILITAFAESTSSEAEIEKGATSFYDKSLSAEKLIILVKSALSLKTS